MSSLDSPSPERAFPNWSAFAERELPFDVEMVSPAVEAAGILQQLAVELDAARQRAEAAVDTHLPALAQQAVFVSQLAQALELYQRDFEAASLARPYRHLRVVKDQMQDLLTRAGLEVEIPMGAPFDAVADQVSVAGWRHLAGLAGEQVAEVLEPIIRFQGRLIRPGRVVMGAPLEASSSEAQSPATQPSAAPLPETPSPPAE